MSFIEEKEKVIAKIKELQSEATLDQIKDLLANEGSLLTDNQQNLVRERRTAYLKNPEELLSLEEFKSSIKAKYGF